MTVPTAVTICLSPSSEFKGNTHTVLFTPSLSTAGQRGGEGEPTGRLATEEEEEENWRDNLVRHSAGQDLLHKQQHGGYWQMDVTAALWFTGDLSRAFSKAPAKEACQSGATLDSCFSFTSCFHFYSDGWAVETTTGPQS